jgi:hypothetical protein
MDISVMFRTHCQIASLEECLCLAPQTFQGEFYIFGGHDEYVERELVTFKICIVNY